MDVLEKVGGWPVDHAAAGVIELRDGRAGVVTSTGPTTHVFPWASVTKLATSLAVLVAVEEGTLGLDEPAGPPGSTVRHLLAHASGLGPDTDDQLVAPGVARIYSNAGYLQLAERLAEQSGMAFWEYLRDGVLRPLAMSATTLSQDPNGGGAAAGLSGPLDDLLALAAEWFVPTLISPATHAEATRVQFPGLAGVLPGFQRFDPCDWGLGPELADGKRPHWTGTTTSPETFGHFGRSGSFVWIDPVVQVGCAALSDRPFGLWAARAWPQLADDVLAGAASSRADLLAPPSDGRAV
jgi:CubicO group peptidase (beta-lactamase class C family)